MAADLVLTILILMALYAASSMFDQYIDGRDLGSLYDGETAVWVALGCLYTVIGFGLIFGVWFGWQHAVVAVGLMLACFVASGLPMYMGDASRSRRNRMEK